MKIKSLLIGSAAALVAVSGARAADAVVIPEPEAVEYVRVCDAAGTGYFYIPGTETCLRISGYVRYQIAGNQDSDGWEKDTEGRVLFQSWTDSEYGAVTTNIRLDANSINGNGAGGVTAANLAVVGTGAVIMDRAYITIGDLSMGLATNMYDFDADGAADTIVANGTDRNQISYTANFGGGSLGIQLVQDGDSNYVPNVIAKAVFDLGDLGVAAAIGYDDEDGAGDSSWGAKLVASYGGLGAHVAYSSDAGNGGDYSAAYDWVLAANYGLSATDNLSINVGAIYAIEEASTGDDGDFVVGAEAKYALTETFEVSSRVRYHEDITPGNAVDDDDGWDWRVRFTSSF